MYPRSAVLVLVLVLNLLHGTASSAELPTCSDCPVMVNIPAGSFLMGGTGRVAINYELAVSKTEISFAQWDACVAAKGCDYRPDDSGWGRGDRPVMFVSWDDAQQYATWLSKRTGQRFRLLTEAEWEYAARAGTTTAYYWGDDASDICQYASVIQGSEACGAMRPAEVGQRRPNAFGLYDMSGGVWEWVQDCWSAGALRSNAECRQRVLRGGAWNFTAEFARSDARSYSAASLRFDNYGFRVARRLK